jgi:hypothetical protein
MVVQRTPANAEVESDSKAHNPNISKLFFMCFLISSEVADWAAKRVN